MLFATAAGLQKPTTGLLFRQALLLLLLFPSLRRRILLLQRHWLFAHGRLSDKQRVQELLCHLLHNVCPSLCRRSGGSRRAQRNALGVVGIRHFELFAAFVAMLVQVQIKVLELGPGQIAPRKGIDELELTDHVKGQSPAVKEIERFLGQRSRIGFVFVFVGGVFFFVGQQVFSPLIRKPLAVEVLQVLVAGSCLISFLVVAIVVAVALF
mmetsp:Transcript_8888/g.21952  ORF Transcript_8888/g.21952 Transcript_8888/m.21952 type:complete len:210 (+) Transcript_8888:1741-2370(+)